MVTYAAVTPLRKAVPKKCLQNGVEHGYLMAILLLGSFWLVRGHLLQANLPTVPILTPKGGGGHFTICPYFCKNLSVVMYRKFRNVPIFRNCPPICPYFLGFRVGRYVEGCHVHPITASYIQHSTYTGAKGF